MNSEPRVSVVVPCYNYGRFVAQAVDSLLRQTFEPIEVIVINDASTDNSGQILDRYAEDARVRVIRHPVNQGHIRTYNEGLALARGEFVGLMSADDYYARQDAVERQVAMFDMHPGVGFVHSGCLTVDEDSRPTGLWRICDVDCARSGFDEFAQLIFGNYVPASGTLVRRRCHLELGDYDPSLPHAADWDLWLRLTTRYQVGYIADLLVARRVHGVNMSVTAVRPAQANREVARVITKAFSALPVTAPKELRRMRSTALRHGWLFTSRMDRAERRSRRAWEGLLDAARQSPDLLKSKAFYGALVRLTLLTTIGHKYYVMLADWRAARRRQLHSDEASLDYDTSGKAAMARVDASEPW